MRTEAEIVSPIHFKHRVPEGPLSDFVSVFWYWSGHHKPHAKERIMPMGTVELIIQLGRHRTSDSGIAGPRSESLIIERHATDQLLGVHFKPAGAFPFLGFPFGDLHNAGITLADLWGEPRARRLLCLLNEAATIDLKFQVLERWLLWIADRPLGHHPAVSFAVKEFQCNPGLRSSAELAETVNLSQRRFIELFRDQVGMTPKLFSRVRRFQAVIDDIQHQEAVDWIDLALSYGYSDQSHFIHDFREFSGLSPTEYLGLRTEHLGHVQVPE
jgi:AraC-like DNA-binding protein